MARFRGAWYSFTSSAVGNCWYWKACCCREGLRDAESLLEELLGGADGFSIDPVLGGGPRGLDWSRRTSGGAKGNELH